MRTFSPSPLASDEIERIWIEAAARAGFRVSRTAEAYAASDGCGGITIGVPELLDVDDAVAQLVFHELCHAITESPPGLALRDWGLDNTSARDVAREHACLRLQAHLADRYGLRAVMAPTTEYRAYYDGLGAAFSAADVEAETRGAPDAAIAIAEQAAARADEAPWREALDEALAATAMALRRDRGAHPLGLPLGPPAETCGTCAWLYRGGRGKAVERCRQAAGPGTDGARVRSELPACARWEPPVDCQACGACCREAYHVVSVAVRDPVVWKQPALIERHGHRFEMRREGSRCAALVDRRGRGGGAIATGPAPAGEPLFACSIYEDRPRTCREFVRGGRHCLDARRRVGLSARPEPARP